MPEFSNLFPIFIWEKISLKYLNSVFDFILPRFCAACEIKLLNDEKIICTSCSSKILIAKQSRLQHEYQRKFASKKIISGFTSFYIFEKDKELQHVIHSLKYRKRFLIGVYLGNTIAEQFNEKFLEWNIDLILPVPLHHLKKADRGYNQAFYIAKGIGKKTSIPYKGNVIKRKKFTESQTSKNLTEREENMKGAFLVKKKKNVEGKNILIVDDVITTGATISECGNVLLKAGAAKIFAASIAIAD